MNLSTVIIFFVGILTWHKRVYAMLEIKIMYLIKEFSSEKGETF